MVSVGKEQHSERGIEFLGNRTRKRGRPKKTWIRVYMEQSRKVGLNESDANKHSRWRLGVNTISSMMRYIHPPPLFGDKTRLKKMDYFIYIFVR